MKIKQIIQNIKIIEYRRYRRYRFKNFFNMERYINMQYHYTISITFLLCPFSKWAYRRIYI